MQKKISLLLVAVLVMSFLTMGAFADGKSSPERPDTYVVAVVEETSASQDEALWVPGASEEFTFETTVPAESFTGVFIDGKQLSESDYTITTNDSGMVVITFSEEFMEFLSVGEHTLTVQAADGQAITTFTIGYVARIKSGAKNGVWKKSSKTELAVESNAEFSKFVSVSVDDVTVDPSKYTAKEESGNTVIYLKVAYLKSLNDGKHTITIHSSDGFASTQFTVAPKSADGTNDLTNTVLWVAIALIALGAIGFFAVGLKRSKAEE